jgi:nucleoside-diphosphate-sugar epimerase
MDWVYIDDVTHGLMALALAPGVEGTTVDIGSGDLVSVRDVVREVFSILGQKEPPQFGALVPRPEEVVRVADVARTESLMHWRARISLQDGLQRTIAWHQASAAARGATRKQ